MPETCRVLYQNKSGIIIVSGLLFKKKSIIIIIIIIIIIVTVLRSRTMRCGGARGMYGGEETCIYDLLG